MNDRDAENFRQFSAVLPAVAEALGGSVTKLPTAENYWYSEVTTPQIVLSFCARAYPKPGQMEVSIASVYSRDERGNRQMVSPRDVIAYKESPTTSINVSMSKGGARIAADIKRRLLPDAVPLYAKLLARVKDREDYRDTQTVTVAQIAKALGLAVPKDGASRFYVDGGGTLTVQGDRVRFEAFSVSPAQALAIVKILKVQL